MPPCSISPAAPHELLPALRVLLDRGNDAERFHEALTTGEHNPAGLLVAKDTSGRIRGAALAQTLPGALGVAWPPRADPPELADALATAVCDWLRDRGVKVCQAFTSTDPVPDMAALERVGFRHVTQLVFLRHELLPRPPFLAPPARSLSFTLEARPLSAEFAAALLATYEATRDCPELNGTRTADELLAGLTDPTPGTQCYLASTSEDTVGVVMLAPGEEAGVVELAYLGVVPSARGRGFGGDLLKFALTTATQARARALTLSVDARNEPALRLYRWHDFVETNRREVWIAGLGEHEAPSTG